MATELLRLSGYYHTDGGDYWFKDSQGGAWQPWNPTITLGLKPILNPVPMYAGGMNDRNKIPIKNEPVGFDLLKNDWVAPHGKGIISDCIFQFDAAPERWVTNWWGDQPRPMPLRDDTLTIRFPTMATGYSL